MGANFTAGVVLDLGHAETLEISCSFLPKSVALASYSQFSDFLTHVQNFVSVPISFEHW